jgi:hypothetical protein
MSEKPLNDLFTLNTITIDDGRQGQAMVLKFPKTGDVEGSDKATDLGIVKENPEVGGGGIFL